MIHADMMFVDGQWRRPGGDRLLAVINPATEKVVTKIALASEGDADAAVMAARGAFDDFAATPPAERAGFLDRILEIYDRRSDELIDAIVDEMGAPVNFARDVQIKFARERFSRAANIIRDYPLVEKVGNARVIREPIGVCGFITPWNWPLNQAASKIAYAMAAGCTMVWKPSEVSPLSAILLAEIIEEAGLSNGVFNMLQGDGPTVGAALARHPDVDMISFTGSTRAGIEVAKLAADTVKRVHQELGGKSANIIATTNSFETAVTSGAKRCFRNTGQSCQAPTRMLVPLHRMDEAAKIAAAAADNVRVGDPRSDGIDMGPLVSAPHWDKVQGLIRKGQAEGATLVAGGPGKPEGLETGYFVRPTVFSNVSNDMTIAREEIFGPVLCIIPYDTVEDAIRIANDSIYGLAAYITTDDLEEGRRIAHRLRAGRVYLNESVARGDVPFGGYRQSGNGREQGVHGFEEFTELKAILGYEE